MLSVSQGPKSQAFLIRPCRPSVTLVKYTGNRRGESLDMAAHRSELCAGECNSGNRKGKQS